MGRRDAPLWVIRCAEQTTSLQKLIRGSKTTRRNLASRVSLCCRDDWSLDLVLAPMPG